MGAKTAVQVTAIKGKQSMPREMKTKQKTQ